MLIRFCCSPEVSIVTSLIKHIQNFKILKCLYTTLFLSVLLCFVNAKHGCLHLELQCVFLSDLYICSNHNCCMPFIFILSLFSFENDAFFSFWLLTWIFCSVGAVQIFKLFFSIYFFFTCFRLTWAIMEEPNFFHNIALYHGFFLLTLGYTLSHFVSVFSCVGFVLVFFSSFSLFACLFSVFLSLLIVLFCLSVCLYNHYSLYWLILSLVSNSCS